MINKIYDKSTSKLQIKSFCWIIAYYILVSCDLTSTYLATPELKYEGNDAINYLNLNWTGIITWCIIWCMFISTMYYKAISELKKPSFNIKNARNIFYIIIVCIFYSHFFITCYLVPNNILGCIYLDYKQSLLFPIAYSYFASKGHLIYYYYYVYSLITIIVCFSILIKTRNNKRQYLKLR